MYPERDYESEKVTNYGNYKGNKLETCFIPYDHLLLDIFNKEFHTFCK